MLGFEAPGATNWGGRYRFELVEGPAQLDQMMAQARENGTRARLVAGFCWKWSEVRPDGSLEPDVKIGDWERPWNAKVPKGKAAPRLDKHPYTQWANTEIGEGEVGCIYSAQGFEFDSAGVIWDRDLVWRTDRWVSQREESKDSPVRNAGPEMVRLVRNAYRVLLTRGIGSVRSRSLIQVMPIIGWARHSVGVTS
jgi:hypothetical protein